MLAQAAREAMMGKYEAKTKATEVAVEDFIAGTIAS